MGSGWRELTFGEREVCETRGKTVRISVEIM